MIRTRGLSARTTLLGAVGALAAAAGPAQVAPPAPEDQIRAAVLAAPADRRDGAGVLGYDAGGKLVVLRERQNELICLADDPRDERFNAACYHESLEPFMARGRELSAQGMPEVERQQTRWKEIEAGTLPMPREPRTLHVLTGSAFDAATGEVRDAFLRWVLYVPFATAESTGLPTQPTPGTPWLMFPGTAGAHIMITPPRPAASPPG
jgi:hypothetical protein